jgi:ubiquitin carboxyl-terminal hydrolase 16/45
MGKTPPKEKEAEGSPKKKAPRVDDAAPTTVPVASAPSPTGKTPPKGEEAEESPRKKAPRLGDAALATGPGASEPNPTGEAPPKEEAERSPPKRSRSPQNKSPRRQDKRPTAALPLPTVPESSELIVEGAGRASDEKRCKCNHVITYSAIEELVESLDSKDAWTCCDCRDEDKAGIVKTRPGKNDLLICVTCYDHLCCGVGSIAYPFGHSRAHALKKKHWFAVLYCDPERGYCFKCNAEVPMPVKFGEGDNEVGLQRIRDIASQTLLALPPSVGKLSPDIALCGPMALLLESLAPFLTSRQGFMLSDFFPSMVVCP